MHSAIIRHKILTIPGLNNSGPTHWQSLWEHKFPHSERVELGSWDNPDKDEWVRCSSHRPISAGCGTNMAR